LRANGAGLDLIGRDVKPRVDGQIILGGQFGLVGRTGGRVAGARGLHRGLHPPQHGIRQQCAGRFAWAAS